jgi:hypothetical protein
MKKQEVIELLQELLNETLKIYDTNGKQSFDSGICHGVKYSIEKISKDWK